MIFKKFLKSRIKGLIGLLDTRVINFNCTIQSYKDYHEKTKRTLPSYFNDLDSLGSSMERMKLFFHQFVNQVPFFKRIKLIFTTNSAILIYAGAEVRSIVENIVDVIYKKNNLLFDQKSTLDTKINSSQFIKLIPSEKYETLIYLKAYGNRCHHPSNPPEDIDIIILTEQMVLIFDWFYKAYIDNTSNNVITVTLNNFPTSLVNNFQKLLIHERKVLINNPNNIVIQQKIDNIESIIQAITSLNFNLIIQKNASISFPIIKTSATTIIELINIHFGGNIGVPFIDIRRFLSKKNDDYRKIISYRITSILKFCENSNNQTYDTAVLSYKILLGICDYFLDLEKYYGSHLKASFINMSLGSNRRKKNVLLAFSIFFAIPLLSIVIHWIFSVILIPPPGPILIVKDKDTLKINDIITLDWSKDERINKKFNNFMITLKSESDSVITQEIIETTKYIITDNIPESKFTFFVVGLDKNQDSVGGSGGSATFVSNYEIGKFGRIRIKNSKYDNEKRRYDIDDDKIILEWDEVPNADLYELVIKGKKKKTVSTKKTSYTFYDLPNGGIFSGEEYQLSITASNKKNKTRETKTYNIYLH